MFSIGIEGGIGAGKSSLAKLLSENFGWECYLEPASAEDGEVNPYLQDYLQDPKRWGLEMQYYLLARRCFTVQKAFEVMMMTGKPYVLDRTAYGDVCFAKVNFLVGNIDERGLRAYTYMRDGVLGNIIHIPTFTIFLDCTVDTLFRRKNIRAREGENKYTREYFKLLQAQIEMLKLEMEEAGSTVITLDWNDDVDYDKVADRSDIVQRVHDALNKHERFNVAWEGLKIPYNPPYFDPTIHFSSPM